MLDFSFITSDIPPSIIYTKNIFKNSQKPLDKQRKKCYNFIIGYDRKQVICMNVLTESRRLVRGGRQIAYEYIPRAVS